MAVFRAPPLSASKLSEVRAVPALTAEGSGVAVEAALSVATIGQE